MPFSCRIRCTTARRSDLGATRRATSQMVSPAPTRVTAMSAGIAGCACGPVRSRPPATANTTMAAATRLATRPDRNAMGGALSASATAGASRAGHATPRRPAPRRIRAGVAAGRAAEGRPRAGGRLGVAALGTTFPPHVAGRLLNCADPVIETPHSGDTGLLSSATALAGRSRSHTASRLPHPATGRYGPNLRTCRCGVRRCSFPAGRWRDPPGRAAGDQISPGKCP